MGSSVVLQNCVSYTLDKNSRKQLKNIRTTMRDRLEINQISQMLAHESIAVPSDIFALSRLSHDDRKLILKNIAISYYEDRLLYKFIRINDNLIELVDQLPDNIKMNLIDSPVSDLCIEPLVSAIDSGSSKLEDEINYIENNRPFYLPNIDIKQFCLFNLKTIDRYKETILRYVDNDRSATDVISNDISTTDECLYCRATKIILSVYRSIISLLVMVGKTNLEDHMIDALNDLCDSTKPLDKEQVDVLIYGFVNKTEEETGIGLEAIDIGRYVSQTIEFFKKIFSFINKKIGSFFKFITSLFKRSKDVKQNIKQQCADMTTEEKEKAKEAGTPKYYGDKSAGKIYAFDAADKYIVTINPSNTNLFVKENPKVVEEQINNNNAHAPILTRKLPPLDDIISYSLAHTSAIAKVFGKEIYTLVMSGKDVGREFIDIMVLLKNYLDKDYHSEAQNALSDKTYSGLKFSSNKFPKLIKLLDHINEKFKYDVDKGENVFEYIRNTDNVISDEDSETSKLTDEFIAKLKGIKIDSSYEEFCKIINDTKVSLNESMFGHPNDTEGQVYANFILAIYKRVVRIYRHYANRGVEYYQQVYVPLAAAHNIGEIGEMAVTLFAGKRKS